MDKGSKREQSKEKSSTKDVSNNSSKIKSKFSQAKPKKLSSPVNPKKTKHTLTDSIAELLSTYINRSKLSPKLEIIKLSLPERSVKIIKKINTQLNPTKPKRGRKMPLPNGEIITFVSEPSAKIYDIAKYDTLNRFIANGFNEESISSGERKLVTEFLKLTSLEQSEMLKQLERKIFPKP